MWQRSLELNSLTLSAISERPNFLLDFLSKLKKKVDSWKSLNIIINSQKDKEKYSSNTYSNFAFRL
jgi:hypothetical protein